MKGTAPCYLKENNYPVLNLYRNRHIGERAILICNGPSLNKMDLSFLKNEICIGLNKIYLGFKQFNFYPKYYVAVNKKVLQQSHQDIKKLTCVKFISNRCPGLFENEALTHIIDTKTPPQYFNMDITKGVEEGWTVTYAALQIAYYLGFKTIIIIGMDHSFEFSGKPNTVSTMRGKDPNHFSECYFANGCTWDNPDLQNSEKSYKIANEFYSKSNRMILDATFQGSCKIFRKIDYKKYFSLMQ